MRFPIVAVRPGVISRAVSRFRSKSNRGCAEAFNRLGYDRIDLVCQTDHEDQGLDVAAADPAGVGA